MDADLSQVRALAADLGRVGARAVPRLSAVVAKTMVDAKQQLQAEAAGHRHAPGIPSAITYEVTNSGLSAEIGPERGGPGSLAFYYYGNSKVGASLPDPMFAVLRAAKRAELFMAKAVGDL